MGSLPAPPGRTPLWIGLGLLLLLSGYALSLSLSRWDAPIPGLLTDPFGRITNYGWPTWSGYQSGLSFPDVITEVDGRSLRRQEPGPPYPGVVLDEEAGRSDGQPLHLLVIGRSGEAREVTVQTERLSGVSWLLLFGGYAMIGWIWLLAAGFSYLVRPDSDAVHAFCRWSVLNALLMITVFDFHTTRKLVPLFLLAYALLPAAMLELGLRFPDDAQPLQRAPALLLLPRALGLLMILVIAVAWVAGRDYLYAGGLCIGLSIIALAAMMAVRWALAEGQRRTQLLLGLLLWIPVYLIMGLTLLVTPSRGGVYIFVAAVPLTAVGILGITYALVRYDLWDSRVFLRRRVLRPLLTGVSGLLLGLCAAVVVVLMGQVSPWVQALCAFGSCVLLVPLHRLFEGWLDRKLFPADVLYRPTVEQLSFRFTDLASRAAVVEAVESTVRQWLPCDRVRFVPLPVPRDRLDDSGEMYRSLPPLAAMAAMHLLRGDASMSTGSPGGLVNPPSLGGSLSFAATNPTEPQEWRTVRRTARAAGIDGIGVEQAAALCKGEVVHPTVAGAMSRHVWARLVIPARFRDQVVGLLAISAKPQSQLFTSEDENLLRTIANQAALALACANAYEQVESLRKAQQAAFRQEKEAALGAFAAEIAHEIRIPINFFRILLDGYGAWVRDGEPPEAEHVEIGREEIDRLERMAGNLRRIATTRTLARQSIELRSLVEHVRLLLRDRLQGRLLEIEIDPLLDVHGDRDAMTQVLVNLIANAFDACTAPGRVGVSGEAGAEGRLRLTVWDMGPGLAADVGKLFQPWFTTKKKGSGLGLPITRRLVRAHGWEIGVERRQERTCFDVIVPPDEWRLRPPQLDEGQFESGPLK